MIDDDGPGYSDRDDRPATAQPPPVDVPGAPSVHALVVADLAELFPPGHSQLAVDVDERGAFGRRKYGQTLQPGNGRDPVADAYEEALDLACYLRQAMAEGVPDLRGLYLATLFTASRLRRLLDARTCPPSGSDQTCGRLTLSR